MVKAAKQLIWYAILTSTCEKLINLSRIFFFQDCSKSTAKCITMSCIIYNMPSQSDAFITVKARLWNSTLVADYPRVDQVTIVSSIDISIPEIYNIQQLNGDDHGFVCLVFVLRLFSLFFQKKLNFLVFFSHPDHNTCLSRFAHSAGRWINSNLDYNCINHWWFTSASPIYLLFVSFWFLQTTKTGSNA